MLCSVQLEAKLTVQAFPNDTVLTRLFIAVLMMEHFCAFSGTECVCRFKNLCIDSTKIRKVWVAINSENKQFIGVRRGGKITKIHVQKQNLREAIFLRTKFIVHSMFDIISCRRMIVTRFCRRKTALIYGYVTIPLTKNSISLNAFSTKSRPFAESQLAMISLQCPSWILYSWFLSGFCLNNTIRTYFQIRSK